MGKTVSQPHFTDAYNIIRVLVALHKGVMPPTLTHIVNFGVI